jgi:hypothetical protein
MACFTARWCDEDLQRLFVLQHNSTLGSDTGGAAHEWPGGEAESGSANTVSILALNVYTTWLLLGQEAENGASNTASIFALSV